MECLNGKILQGTEVIADDLEIWIAHGSEGDTDWNGTFELPAGTHVDTGAQFNLVLDDGRRGVFSVTNVGGDDNEPHRVGFRGAGPLSSK